MTALSLVVTCLPMLVGAQKSTILGKGWDLTTADMWSYSQVFTSDVYHGMPDACFIDDGCGHTTISKSENFDSISSWQNYYAEHLGISFVSHYVNNLIPVTLRSSLGEHSNGNWTDDRASSYLTIWNRQACYQMHSDCMSNASYLHPNLLAVMKRLPKDMTNQLTMERWVKEFIRRFGSHINAASQHGAQLKTLTSISKQTQYSGNCLKADVCMSIPLLHCTGKCPNEAASHCKNSTLTDSMISRSCVMVGGDPLSASSLCEGEGTPDDLDQFLSSGDMTKGSSAIQYTFKPISDVLLYMGYYEESTVLEKALEYHQCKTPRFQWVKKGDGNFGCQCALQCGNEGVLDEDSCTCKCKGDALHGFKGGSCDMEYGHCQAGRGTYYDAAKNCRKNNMCGSDICRATDVCCKSTHGKCCPFGSTCSCPKFSTNCKCITTSEEQMQLV